VPALTSRNSNQHEEEQDDNGNDYEKVDQLPASNYTMRAEASSGLLKKRSSSP
jgi:hypothetical protein